MKISKVGLFDKNFPSWNSAWCSSLLCLSTSADWMCPCNQLESHMNEARQCDRSPSFPFLGKIQTWYLWVRYLKNHWQKLGQTLNLLKSLFHRSYSVIGNRLDCVVYVHFVIHAKLSEFKGSPVTGLLLITKCKTLDKIIMFQRLFIKRIKPTELGRWNYQAPMVKADLANCDSCGSCGLENIYL